MSTKIILSFTSKDKSIDWSKIARAVRDALQDNRPLPNTVIIPCDTFMTALRVNDFPSENDSADIIDNAQIVIIMGRHATQRLKCDNLRNIPAMSISLDNFNRTHYPLLASPYAEFLTEKQGERVNRVVDAVIAGLIIDIIKNAVSLFFR